MNAVQAKAVAAPAKNNMPFFNKGGEQDFFHASINEQPFFSKTKNNHYGIQTKLTVGAPNDVYEKEADTIADKVVQRLAQPQVISKKDQSIQAKPSSTSFTPFVQKKCAHCEEEEKLQKEKEYKGKERIQKKPIFESDAEPPDDDKKVQRNCAECEKKEKLQKKSDGSSQTAPSNIESRLSSSKGGGSTLPAATREQMESSFGADFSNVRIHNDSSAVQMSRELNAQAFTHGSDIYFNSGKYDANSEGGKHLLAHELTHVVQQNGSSIQTKPVDEAPYLTTNTPTIQRAWYNFSIPFTDYEFDPSIEGVKTAASLTASTVKKGAVFVKDKVVEAAEWVYEKIKGLINSGIEWLTDKFNDIKNFASTVFDQIKNTLSSVLGLITNPLALIKGALNFMNADTISMAWNALKSGANVVWSTIKSAIDGLLSIGNGIWKTVSGFVSSLFSTVEGLLESTAFGLLPEFVKNEARSLFNTVRSLWESIKDFWDSFWQKFTDFIHKLLSSIESFVNQVISFAIDTVIKTVRMLREAFDYIQRFIDDPEGTLKPVVNAIVGKIKTEGPPKAEEVRKQKMAEGFAQSQTPKSESSGTIQRAPAGKIERSTASFDEVGEGLIAEMVNQWDQLDFGKLVWEGLKSAFWPPATIKAIGHEFYELWNTDWKNAVDSLFMPRNIFDNFGGFFHDVWSNFLILLDFPLALWRRLNNVLMLLMVYISILLLLVGAVGGAIIAGPPGALAGMGLALEAIEGLGEFLLASFLLAESITIIKVLVELFTARQTKIQKKQDYVQTTASLFGIAIALLFMLVFFIIGSIVSAIVAEIKGIFKAPAPEVPSLKPAPVEPPKQLGPGPEPPKQLGPGPEPPKQLGPGPEPPKQLGPGPEPPKAEPPKIEPPKEVPPEVEPPKTEPPKTEPPEQKPPKEKPSKKKPPKEEPGKKGPAKDFKDMTPDELAAEADKKPRQGESKQQAEERSNAAKEEAKRRGYCFAAGTIVQTPEGPLPIETLIPGQLVFAKAEDESIGIYSIIECINTLSSTLYHLEIERTSFIIATRNHPVFVVDKGWIKVKDLEVGNQLISLTGSKVSITKIIREQLAEPVSTYNLHIQDVHSYFVGDGPSIWVHNGTPLTDPLFNGRLFWGFGASGPRQRTPRIADPENPNPKLRQADPGDVDGASAWKTESLDESGRFLGARNTEGGTGNHGAITEAQLKSEGLVAVETPGTGAPAEAGLTHVSIRPENNPDPNVALTENEMELVKTKLEKLAPEVTAKPKDFAC